MSEYSKSWDKQHQKYKGTDWIDKPTIFAENMSKYFPKSGKLLDLGAGQGQDSRFFANQGYQVVSTDFSDEGLKLNREKSKGLDISVEKLDLSKKFIYKDQSFDIVYSHLALHYFDKETTQSIFTEIHRTLKGNGIVAILLNSTADDEYNSGEVIEKDFFKIGQITKRYFNPTSLSEFVTEFETLLLDDQGKTYKDKKNLVRFVGKKVV